MPDEVDELILKMQHLEAQARAQREAQALEARGKSLKSRAQQLAWSAQSEVSAAEAQQREGEEKLQRAHDPGLKPITAADLLEEGRRLTDAARTRLVKARAKLNFALDQMDEAERREYEALRADARAEAHRQMAEDPLFNKPPPPPSPLPSTSHSPSPSPSTSPSSSPSTSPSHSPSTSTSTSPSPSPSTSPSTSPSPSPSPSKPAVSVPPPPGPPSFVPRRIPTLPDKPLQRRVYDVAIIGPDLGGAAAAALLAKRGLRVLMAPLSQGVVARDSEGWLLPAAHPMIPPLRQLSGSIFALDELGLAADLQRQSAGTATGAFQLLGEELRLSLPSDGLRRRAELRRELGEDAAAAEAALEALETLGRPWDPLVSEPPPLPARGFFERRRLRKVLPNPPPEVPQGIVGEALHALAPFAASLVGDTAPEATAREAAALFRAPLRLWGGAAQLADLLRAKAETAGAHLTTESCSRLRLARKSAMFDLAGAEVQVNMVVLACPPETIRQLCDGGGRAERAVADEAQLTVERKEALAHFVVRPEGLPQALEEAALLLGDPLGPLVISAVPARRARGEVAGERLLTVGRVVDAGFSDAQALLSSVRKALDPVLPFFDRHVVHESVELDPLHGQRILKPHEGLHSEPIGLRPVSAAHDRVLFASREVYPGFGLEGSILAARACATQALELSGRKQVSAT